MAPDEKDDEDIFDLSDSFDEGDDDDVLELTDVVGVEAEEDAAPAEDLSLGDEGGEDFDQELDDLFGDDEGGDAPAKAEAAPAEPAGESDDGGFEMGFDEDDGGLDFDAEMDEAQEAPQADVADFGEEGGGDDELDFSGLEDDAGGEPVADLEQGEDEDISLDFGEEETAEVEGVPDDDDLGDLEPEMDMPDLPDVEGDEVSADDDDDDDLDSAIADMSGLDDLVDEMDFPQAATKGVPAEKARAPKAAPAPPVEEILEESEDAAFDVDDFVEEAPEAPADAPADAPAEAPVEDVFEEEAPELEMAGDEALPDVEDMMAGLEDDEDVPAEVPEPEAEFPEPEMEQPEMAEAGEPEEAEEAGAAWDMGGDDDALPDVDDMAAGMGMGESLAESDAMDMDTDMGGAEPVADMIQDQDGELPDVQELMAGLEDEGSPTAEYINPETPVEDLGEEAETAWDEAPVATHQDLEGIYDRLSALEEQAHNPSGGLSIEELDLRIEEALTEDSELFQRIKDAIAFELKDILDSALQEHLEPLKEKLMAGSADSEARLRLKALEENSFSHKEWNIFSLQLKEEIMSQVGKTMPQAAARVLREEIAAMVKDMG
jgi:pilus assembly protein FimV